MRVLTPGGAMRRIAAGFVLSLSLLGCGMLSKNVPLVTVDVDVPDSCWLLFRVVDVVADPTFGTADKADGSVLRWPTGFTAWRVGSEVEVRNLAGKVVLTTGARYRISPAHVHATWDPKDWVAGCPKPCPDCELGEGLL